MLTDPKRPAPWDPSVDLDAEDDRDWPLGMDPSGKLRTDDPDAPDEEEGESDEV